MRTADEFRRQLCDLRRPSSAGFHSDRVLWRAPRRPRRPPAARRRAPAHRHRVRAACQPPGSAARQPAVRPLRGRRPARSRAHGCRCRSSISARPRLSSSAIFRSLGALAAVGAADPLRIRPGQQQRQGEPRAGAADRGDPAAARAVSRRLLRAAMGAAPGDARAGRSAHRRCRRGSTCRAPNTSCPCSSASARRSLFFFFQKDLGPALFLSCVFLACTPWRAAASAWPLAGLARCSCSGFYVGLSAGRLAHAGRTGAHLAVALGQRRARAAIRSRRRSGPSRPAGSFGTGLGLGDTRYLPAGHTDLVLAAVGEELGRRRTARWSPSLYAVVGVARLPHRAAGGDDYGFFLAIVADAVPDRSGAGDGGRHARADPAHRCRDAVPELRRIGDGGELRRARHARVDPARPSARRAICAVPRADAVARRRARASPPSSLLAVLVNVQVVQRRRLRRPAAPRRAGRRRAAVRYNPRVLDLVREIPRGTRVRPRRSAAGDRRSPRVAAGARQRTASSASRSTTLSADPANAAIRSAAARFICWGMATRVNWSAPNTSYIERDAEDRCAASTITRRCVPVDRRVGTADGDASARLPRARAAAAAPARAGPSGGRRRCGRPRDVHLTIDARLQVRVGDDRRALRQKVAAGRAAAVVIDPDTGECWRVASYPWPDASAARADRARARRTLLDRARYGLYPPGSTFKLVTAAAALRQDLASSRATFTCARLPDGRVGAKHRPAGAARSGTTCSTRIRTGRSTCTTGWSTLQRLFRAARGRARAEPLVDTAARLGHLVDAGGDAMRRVARNASPGRLRPGRRRGDAAADGARGRGDRRRRACFATCAGTGAIAAEAAKPIVLQPRAARLLAGYMRDVVLTRHRPQSARPPVADRRQDRHRGS